MGPSDLAFFTTEELVNELMRRTTFLGVVVHSGSDFKNGEWIGEKVFKVRFNSNLSKTETSRLLKNVGRGLGNASSGRE